MSDIKAEIRELRLGEKIRKLRQERRLTLQELADATGLSKPLLSQIENDQVIPPLATLLKIAMGEVPADGGTATLTLRWMTARRWARLLPPSRLGWTALRVGPFVLAFRLDG